MLRSSLLFACAALLLPCPLLGDEVPLAVDGGRCEMVVDTSRPSDHCYLVIGSLADGRSTTQVSVRTESTGDPVSMPRDKTVVPAMWRELVAEQGAMLDKARRLHRPIAAAPHSLPAKTRTFHVFVKGRDLENPAHYAAVTAELRATGRHCQVYVDRDALGQANQSALLADILQGFDGEVYPWASRHLGVVHDVDRDGRFTILLTPLLGTLQDGAVSVDGFVRGTDFDRDMAAPFSNGCDMMYLNSRLQPGPHLRTLLAHEYTHAVLYCEHVMATYLPHAAHRDEEGWLNEGIAHLVEEELGHGWSNLDYRIGAYSSCPERYPLVVADYFRAGLWRTAGTRGATYLFLRSCGQRYGIDMLTRLSRSNLEGVPNLEAATGERFDELFRRWAVTQLLDDGGWARKARMGRLWAGPRFHDMALGSVPGEFTVVGTAALYVRLHSPKSARTRVIVQGDANTPLQVTLVQHHDGQPWLELSASKQPGSPAVTLHLIAHGGDVRLEAVAWERLVPTGKASEDTGYEAGEESRAVEAWFGAAQLRAGTPRASRGIALPASLLGADVVFKVRGRDNSGKMVAGWALLCHNKTSSTPTP
jgi:hypothetical protein